jgi:hypothetical protein
MKWKMISISGYGRGPQYSGYGRGLQMFKVMEDDLKFSGYNLSFPKMKDYLNSISVISFG